MRIAMLAVVCVGLAGCEGSIASDAMKGPQVLAQQDDGQCRSYGASPGSDAYTQCRMMIAQQRETRHESRRRGMLAAAIAMQPPPSRPVNCTSTGYGNVVNTSCR